MVDRAYALAFKAEPTNAQILWDHAQALDQHGRGAQAQQLYYQIAVQGRSDLPLAPDEQAGFLMTILRMLAFRPARAFVASRAMSPRIASWRPSGATTSRFHRGGAE